MVFLKSKKLLLRKTALAFTIIVNNSLIRNNNRTRRFGIHEINKTRKTQGAFSSLHNLLLRDDERFISYYRLTIEAFSLLLDLIRPHLPHQPLLGGKRISVQERLAVTLRLLASGNSQTSIAFEFRMGISTVNKIIAEVCSAIWLALQPIYLKPPTTEQWRKNADDFCKFWNMPYCCAAIDGKHSFFTAPDKSGSEYYCYKVSFIIVYVLFLI